MKELYNGRGNETEISKQQASLLSVLKQGGGNVDKKIKRKTGTDNICSRLNVNRETGERHKGEM